MSYVKKLAIASVALGALSYAPVAMAQGPETPGDAKTTPQSQSGASSMEKGEAMDKGSMQKDSMQKKSMMKGDSMEKSDSMKK